MDYYTNTNNDRMPQQHSCLIHVIDRTDNGGMRDKRQVIAPPDPAAIEAAKERFRERLQQRRAMLATRLAAIDLRIALGEEPAYAWANRAKVATYDERLAELRRIAETHPVPAVLSAVLECVNTLWDQWLDTGRVPSGFGELCEALHAGLHEAMNQGA